MAQRQSESGFSLAETLVAVTIFVIVVVPFAWMFVNSIRSSGQSQHLTVAYNAAQRQIQMLRAIPYANLDNSPANSFDGTGSDLFATPTTVNGVVVYRTTIPESLLPDTKTELPSARGTIELRPYTLVNGARSINYAAATVTITWDEVGRAPMTVTARTLLAEGGMNDF